ncbi:metallophosphoesterase [Aquihabitans sp. G128]|uniref:metallophosphoesterase family protein n=1 Tax=Aquihabitans sp. G128 TaxID=2849779 RepID=UPI001C24D4E1|nr:metallophosphoesterase [Aquihabitans sp. G128]QXC60027.1 metallophosphoesterase [Aquihabitans sp. G128]
MRDDPVGDWAAAIGAEEPAAELTTVGTREAVVHQGHHVRRHADLEPDTAYELDGFAFRTLAEPGELLATFATVNDVHFGEEACGIIEGSDLGPVFRSGPGEDPYPEVMNRGAVTEIAALGPDAVIVKGDLTSNGTVAEYEAFRAAYEPAFGDRLTVVRGNHESYNRAPYAREAFQEVVLPGVVLAVLDTSVDGEVAGTVTAEQLEQVDELGARADRPVLLFGHHHLGDRHSPEKADQSFGIDVDASEALLAVVARRPRVRGYFAGHTHRNRVRRFAATGDVAWVEVACVKDYPGAWAEYRVHEGGVVQVEHRISTPEALAWTEQTRHMYAGLYRDYAFGTLADRCFVLPATAAG